MLQKTSIERNILVEKGGKVAPYLLCLHCLILFGVIFNISIAVCVCGRVEFLRGNFPVYLMFFTAAVLFRVGQPLLHVALAPDRADVPGAQDGARQVRGRPHHQLAEYFG